MHICLIRPPAVTSLGIAAQNPVPPLGLAYVAASLRAAGHSVTAVDAVGAAPARYRPVPGRRTVAWQGLEPDEIARAVDPGVELIGLSSMFTVAWPYDRLVVEALRRRFPAVPIVVGGEHATACWRHVLDTCSAVDLCVLGEGEETIVALARCLEEGGDVEAVGGLAFRRGGVAVRGAARARIRAVDDIPEPDWSLFPLPAYSEHALTWGVDMGVSMPLLASRGCPYQCAFCSSPAMWGTRWVARAPSSVVAEMKRGVERHGARVFNLYDLTLIVNKTWITAFAQAILDAGLDVTWQLPSGTRTEILDGELAGLLYRSGLRHLNYAPESGSAAVLRRIRKFVDLERMLQSARTASAAGLKIKANIIYGFPGETLREALDTFWLIGRLAWAGVEDVGPYRYAPYPGTEIFAKLEAQGLLTLDDAYFERLRAVAEPGRAPSLVPGLSGEALSALALGSAAWFYGVRMVRRPATGVELVKQLVRGDGRSKLAKQLILARRKQEGLRAHARRRLPGPVAGLVTLAGLLAGRDWFAPATADTASAPAPGTASAIEPTAEPVRPAARDARALVRPAVRLPGGASGGVARG